MNSIKKNYFRVNFKKGLGKPAYVYANDHASAEKEGLAAFKKRTGFVETVDEYSTVGNTIESVELIGE